MAHRIDSTELIRIASAMGFGVSMTLGMTTIGTTTMPTRAGTG